MSTSVDEIRNLQRSHLIYPPTRCQNQTLVKPGPDCRHQSVPDLPHRRRRADGGHSTGADSETRAQAGLQSGSMLVNGFVLFLWFTLPLTYPGETAFNLGPLGISREGIALAALISIKTNAAVLVLISLIATSSVAALGQALVQLKMPIKLCLLLLFSYRYIFVIHQEYLRLVRAARLRCFKAGTNMHTYRTTGYLFGMTLVKSHHRAHRVRQAMVLRGFQGQFRSLCESQLGKNEVGFSLLILTVVAALITVEIISRFQS